MPAKVKLDVAEGPAKGTHFEFNEHDTFIVGRKKGSRVQFPNDGQDNVTVLVISVLDDSNVHQNEYGASKC